MKSQHEIKQTKVEKIPKDWEVMKLGDSKVTEAIYYGITAKASNQNTGLKMLRTTDINDYKFDYAKLPFCEITDSRNQLNQYNLGKGDIVIARAGTVGVSVLVSEDYKDTVFGSYLIKVKLKSGIYPKFIHYFLQSNLYWNHIQKAQGSTLKNINLPLLRSLSLPLPPLPEQQKIAEILSTADEAIQKVDEAIEKTQKLKKGLMQELFTKGVVDSRQHTGKREFKDTEIGRIPKEWEVIEIKKLGKVITGKTPPTANKEYWNGDVPFITPFDIGEEKHVYNTERYISAKGAQKVGNILPKDAVLVVCIGSTIGKIALTFKESIFNQQINALICKDNINPHYVYYAISSKANFLKSFSGTAAVPIIKKSLFETFKLPLPSLLEQQKIAEILSTVDKRLELLRERKAKFERVKKGLMGDLLTGRKRVNL
ncbi:MAG: restriction endonuclease subunit S [Thermodesulfovibrionales bacterium]|nr:restriction endonuclease subunit S [Thermodesulfovibrionales bacterium]